MSAPSGRAANLLSMPFPVIPQPSFGPRRMSRRGFWRRFGRLEHERLEFKRSPANLQESVVAMSMNAGGVILVGVGDDRRITGCPLDQAALDRVGFVAHETGVPVRVRMLDVSGTPVMMVAVPRVGDRVVTTSDGRILRRLGSANQPLRGDAVSRFVLERLA
jgi:predicted HTH transcriptional regulator